MSANSFATGDVAVLATIGAPLPRVDVAMLATKEWFSRVDVAVFDTMAQLPRVVASVFVTDGAPLPRVDVAALATVAVVEAAVLATVAMMKAAAAIALETS